jgi:hypothetical protein
MPQARKNGDESNIGMLVLGVGGIMALGLGYWTIVEKPKRDAQINQMNAISQGIKDGSIKNVSVAQADVQHRGTNIGVGAIF